MPNVNQVILAGHLGRDAELKHTPSGTAILAFSVATSRRWKQDGQPKEETTWHNVIHWQPAEWLPGALTKGAPVMLTGRLSTRSYEKDGRKVYVTEVVADRVWPLAPRVKGEPEPDNAPQYGPDHGGITDEDVPF